MHYANSKDGENMRLPVKISQYKYLHNDITKDKNDAIQVEAGFNVSMSLSLSLIHI